jgi:hypothetical protein
VGPTDVIFVISKDRKSELREFQGKETIGISVVQNLKSQNDEDHPSRGDVWQQSRFLKKNPERQGHFDTSGIGTSRVERPRGWALELRKPKRDCSHIRGGHVDQRYSPGG